jgi:phage baseplate assembly protein gpV
VSGVIDIIRDVAAQELLHQRAPVLATVTEVFAHTEKNDDNNYAASVRLKHDDLELPQVPLLAPHIGVAAPPRVGDLVLVTFVDGDLNQPLITGRFYHADDRPPLHQEDEVLFEHRVPDGTLNHLRFTKDGDIYLQRDVAKPKDNSEAKSSVSLKNNGDIVITVGGDKIKLTLSGDAVTLECKTVSVKADVTIEGDLTVKNAAHSTKISGNTVEGA